MKLHVFSDLHHRHPVGWTPKLAGGADTVVCAGDVCEGLSEAMRLLRAWIPAPTPIITVAGHHSFYNRVMIEEWASGREAAAEHGITLLENEAVVIDGVRFIGATLWTDFALNGDLDRGPAMVRAQFKMDDHRLIEWCREPSQRFRPAHALDLHRQSIEALNGFLTEPFKGPTIVLTHHAPSPRSIAPRHHGDGLNPAFCSDLSALIMRHQPFAWIHGHMHTSADYHIGRTRVVNNPHGCGRENAEGFDIALILDTKPGSRALDGGPRHFGDGRRHPRQGLQADHR